MFPPSGADPHPAEVFWHKEKLTDNERNHGCAISPGGLEALDELLDLPDFNLFKNVFVSELS